MKRQTVKILSLSMISGLALGASLSTAQENSSNVDTVLETIVVTGDKYLEDIATSATKTATPAIETPMSIVTITRGQMDHQNSQTVSQALRYSSGVLSDVEATTRNDSVFLRGFGGFGQGTVVVNFMDGLKLPRGQAFAQFSIDPFLLERLEVVKGPSAVLYGQINPGGLVNQISRQPTRDNAHEIRVEIGNNDRFQAGITSRGTLDEAGNVLYSLTALGRSSGSRFDDVDEERIAFAPSITWSPDSDTSLTVNSFYTRDPEGGYFNSALARDVAPAEFKSVLDSELNFGDPGVDEFDREQSGVGYQFTKRFDNLSFYSSLRYAKVETDLTGVQLVAPLTPAGLLPRAVVQSDEVAKGIASDNRLEIDLSTGKWLHNLMVGIDYQRNTADWVYGFGAVAPLDVRSPIYNQSAGPFATVINDRQVQEQTGLYLQDQIEIDKFRLTLGLRHDWANLRTENNATGVDSKQSDEETSYRAGLVYLFDNGIAPYASYSTSFEPTVGVGEDGAPFRPTTARQFEAGVKYQPDNTPLLITASAFDIEQDDTLTPGSMPGFSVQGGQISSQGIEFEVRGNVSENLELIASATWLDTEVSESSNSAVVGKRPQAVPEQFASAWASYRIPSGALSGLNVGGGVRYVSKSYGDDLNTVRSPAYTVADLALLYDLGEWIASLHGTELTLNVSNLFDKEYYTSCSFNIYCQYGNRREVLAGLKYTW